jgi:hypothetical protein
VAGTHRESDRCSCDLAVDSRFGYAYNEEAFRYLLAVQQKRSQRSERPFLLLLVELTEQPGAAARIDATTARKLFSSLWRALREADVIGWYRDARVAGAVLTEARNESWADVSQRIVQRVTDALTGSMPPSVSRRLQVRICHMQPRLKS